VHTAAGRLGEAPSDLLKLWKRVLQEPAK